MRKFIVAALTLAAVVFAPSIVSAQEIVLSQTIEVGKGRPLWKKMLRGTARALTLDAIGAAQTSDTIKQGEPFELAWDHNGVDTNEYQVYINTALHATVPVTLLVNGTAKTPFAGGLPKGSYDFIVKALGPGGEGVSAPHAVSVTAGNPAAPGQIRVIKGQQ